MALRYAQAGITEKFTNMKSRSRISLRSVIAAAPSGAAHAPPARRRCVACAPG